MVLVWVVGAVVLVAAGFGAVVLPWWRARDVQRRVAWSAARAAIDSAGVSRDASRSRVDEAERLLAKAEAVAADRGGTAAARTASECAYRADRLWREAVDG